MCLIALSAADAYYHMGIHCWDTHTPYVLTSFLLPPSAFGFAGNESNLKVQKAIIVFQTDNICILQ